MRVPVRNNRDSVVRQASARRERRNRLLAEAVARHGVAALGLLFELLETELGIDLGVDARLEGLIEASPAAMDLLAAKDGRR
jgi:hypothetical protein